MNFQLRCGTGCEYAPDKDGLSPRLQRSISFGEGTIVLIASRASAPTIITKLTRKEQGAGLASGNYSLSRQGEISNEKIVTRRECRHRMHQWLFDKF